MSLRRRLFTLLLVACIALGASVFGILRLVRESDEARQETAAAVGLQSMRVLARHVDAHPDADLVGVEGLLADLAHTVGDGTVGVCNTEGKVLAARSTPRNWPPEGLPEPPFEEGDRPPAPPGSPPPGPPPPGDPPRGGPGPRHGRPTIATPDDDGMLRFDREAVVKACRAATVTPASTRAFAPTDLLTVATVRTRRGEGPVAFALSRVPRTPRTESRTSVALLAVLGLTTASLLALTAHGAWVLRASTASLQASVAALARDLRAPVAEPAARELADVATHLRRFAANLADAQERERELGRTLEDQRRLAGLGRVVAGVAHEVRNPLAGMKLRLDGIALRPLDTRTQTDIAKCLREVARLDRLVRSLLLAARQRPVSPVPFVLAPFVAERVALAEPLAAERAVRIETTIGGDGTLVGEQEGLAGLVDNLLRNAIEASPEGGVVRLVVAPEGTTTRLEVIDEGPGIPPARAAELFEPFFTTKASGTGLGLVVARAAAEAHGGTLTYARRDASTVFTALLPAPAGTNVPPKENEASDA